MNEMQTGKFKQLMKSRKFWASVISILVSLGVVGASDEGPALEAVLALVPVLAGAAYTIGTAIEDAGRKA